MGSIICSKCGLNDEHHAKKMCTKCYRKTWVPKIALCKSCKRDKPHHSQGYCSSCYNRIYYKDYYRLASRKQYTGITKEIFQKLPKQCIICGFNKIIDIHHLISRKNGGTNDITNLITLCPNHHKMIHHADYRNEILDLLKDKRSISANL